MNANNTIKAVANSNTTQPVPAKKAFAQINPSHPTGLEPPPPDYQYDNPLNAQMYYPLNRPNQVDADDLLHIYNPYKHLNHIGNYAQ